MDAPLRAALSRDGRLALLGPTLLLLLGLFAYRPLLLTAPGAGSELWLFGTQPFPALPILALAGWLLWRRRGRLLALPPRSDRGTAAAGFVVGTGLFLWAHLTGAGDLLLASLAANLLAFASAARGRPGARAVCLPAIVLLLGLRIPAPLHHELVWQLQLWTARGAAWLMESVGRDVVLGGVLLRSGEAEFLVIEACSGLRGIQLLTLVALVVRELFADSGARQWLLVLVAPWLAFALNLMRVALIAATADPEALGGETDHTPQGLAVLSVGTALLYALGWGMERGARRRADGASHDRPQRDPALPTPRWTRAAAPLAALGLLSIAAPHFPRAETAHASTIGFPRTLSGWSSEDLSPDRLFVGALPQALHRRYERKRFRRALEIVELFVSYEVAGNPVTSRLFSSKLARPGRDWSLERSRRVRVWTLGLDADLALASRDSGSEHALVYTWRLRDQGIWRETSRSLLALETGPARRERPRAVIRLVAPALHDGPLAHDRAKQSLDQFISDFRDELAGL